MQTAKKPINVLLVEDDSGDVIITKEAFSRTKLPYNIKVVQDGEQALAFLRKQSPYEKEITPDIILLDLNLPRVDGREFLAEVKNHADLKMIPVVILTTSNSDRDLEKVYKLHASCYLIKPMDFPDFESMIRSFSEFWFGWVRFPQCDRINN